VADLIRGKSVKDALIILEHTPNRAAKQLSKLIHSAVSNAGGDPGGLVIKEIRVDGGVTLKRIRPRARGSAFVIRKRASHVALALGKKEAKDESIEGKDMKEKVKS